MPSLAHVRRAALALALALGVIVSPARTFAAPEARRNLDVLVPQGESLELLAFWTALGSGAFAREGLEVRAVAPAAPTTVEAAFTRGDAPFAILSGPEYQRLMVGGFGFELVANLLQNDPLELVARAPFARRAEIQERQPLPQRLLALRGAPVGVLVKDRGRLFRLFKTQGMDASRAQIETHPAEEMLQLFGDGKLDVVYVEPPYLERALAKDGVIIVAPAAGEIESFAQRAVETLAVTRAFATEHPDAVEAMLRAITHAEHLVHADPPQAVSAILAALPDRKAPDVEPVVKAYVNAVPSMPHLEPLLVKREAAFYPAGGDPMDLSTVNLDAFLFAHTSGAAPEPAPAPSSAPTVATLPRTMPVGPRPRTMPVVPRAPDRAAPSTHHGPSRRWVGASLGLVLAIALLFALFDGKDAAKERGGGA
jgi:ABC-type nitrate/sulfonate/bicarbonate transport system substrate-binding protein